MRNAGEEKEKKKEKSEFPLGPTLRKPVEDESVLLMWHLMRLTNIISRTLVLFFLSFISPDLFHGLLECHPAAGDEEGQYEGGGAASKNTNDTIEIKHFTVLSRPQMPLLHCLDRMPA